ncbi:nuclear transport factor 2 family protein [Oceanisphaera psychrotolerans]|uniref:nuclear transport factor 2 family protein n=1 Tax=Oceanisphaera psychrotolerans TaxID=1414654 RepID=UPI000AC69215|nr:nuclear transport factor 2 family protein [Oceanisphaera psychrotolerans]
MKLASLVLGAILTASFATPAVFADESPKAIASRGMQALFVDFDATSASELLAEDYIQHNPAVPTGAAPLIGFLPALKDSGLKLTTRRLISEGDFVVAHNLYENAQALGGETLIAFDVFRIDNGRLAEHWDNLAPLTRPNPSGRTQLDGPTEAEDLDKTAENKALVTGFVETILMRGEVDRITDFISTETYLQHNSGIADGLDGLGAALAAMAEQGITMAYDELHLVVAEGSLIFTASEGTLGETSTAFFRPFPGRGWQDSGTLGCGFAHPRRNGS